MPLPTSGWWRRPLPRGHQPGDEFAFAHRCALGAVEQFKLLAIQGSESLHFHAHVGVVVLIDQRDQPVRPAVAGED